MRKTRIGKNNVDYIYQQKRLARESGSQCLALKALKGKEEGDMETYWRLYTTVEGLRDHANAASRGNDTEKCDI